MSRSLKIGLAILTAAALAAVMAALIRRDPGRVTFRVIAAQDGRVVTNVVVSVRKRWTQLPVEKFGFTWGARLHTRFERYKSWPVEVTGIPQKADPHYLITFNAPGYREATLR